MHEPLTTDYCRIHRRFIGTYWLPEEFGKARWHAIKSGRVQTFSAVSPKCSKLGVAQPRCLLKHRVKHRSEIARRRIDDLQNFGHCGLSGLGFVALCPCFIKLSL